MNQQEFLLSTKPALKANKDMLVGSDLQREKTYALTSSHPRAHTAGPVCSGKAGYEGFLNNEVAPVSEILQDNGYYTMLAGKVRPSSSHRKFLCLE